MLHAFALVFFYLQVYHYLMFQMWKCVWYHAWEFLEQKGYGKCTEGSKAFNFGEENRISLRLYYV
jgi:hypothetical protein